ncbi:MAG: RNA polymerase sigma-54 factor, partial [Candidatus Omnitrophota bacterium]
MNLKLHTKQFQKQILAPVLQQSIELLQLPLVDLDMVIAEELEKNPALESERVETTLVKQLDSIIQNKLKASVSSTHESYHTENESGEGLQITRDISLEEHLLKQLRLEFSEELHIKIGEEIIGYLNNDGYFEGTLEEIAEKLNITDVAIVEHILLAIQNLDPLGVGSRHLRECLLTQVPFRFNGHSDIPSKIISDHLNDLALKKYTTIAKALKINTDEVKTLAKKISSLEPRPARKFQESPSNIYVKPDIHIEEVSGEYKAVIHNHSTPQLHISPAYKNILKNENVKPDEVEFIKEKIQNALIFMKSLEQRKQTIKQIADYITTNQQEFFVSGHTALKPMTLSDIAKTLDRNESTISRAICNKYMDSPQGILPLKYFFSQGVTQSCGKNVSNRSIKEEIFEIVSEEDKTKPLSDEAILTCLKKRNISVARRTISKYRKELKILPSHLRRS